MLFSISNNNNNNKYYSDYIGQFGDKQGGGVTHTSLDYTGICLFIYEQQFYIF
jgi:hypothetical protein